MKDGMKARVFSGAGLLVLIFAAMSVTTCGRGRDRASLASSPPRQASSLPLVLPSDTPIPTRSAGEATPPTPLRSSAALAIAGWGNGGSITLTFDDYGATERVNTLLDILGQDHVRAIFFLTGLWTAAHPDLIRRMLREGHLVENHTYDHARLTRLSASQIRDEIVRGYPSTLFRPPYGAYNPLVASIAAQLGYQLVLWTIDTRDWTGVSASSILATVLGQARPGAIVLMHMHGAHTLEALPEMIRRLQAAGYVLDVGAVRAVPTAGVAVPAPTAATAPSTWPSPTVTPEPSPTGTPAASSTPTEHLTMIPRPSPTPAVDGG